MFLLWKDCCYLLKFTYNGFTISSKIGFTKVRWFVYPCNKDFIFAYCYFFSQNLNVWRILNFYGPAWQLIIDIKSNSTPKFVFVFSYKFITRPDIANWLLGKDASNLVSFIRESVMIFTVFDLFPYFIWFLTVRNTISRHTCWCCRYKLSKVKIINKSRKIVSHHILPFSVRVQTVLIKMGSCIYVLMTNQVCTVTFTFYFQTFVDILSFFGEPISSGKNLWNCNLVSLQFLTSSELKFNLTINQWFEKLFFDVTVTFSSIFSFVSVFDAM